jgi:hypothetical protein
MRGIDMDITIVEYINSIVLSNDRLDGISIGTCYIMAAEKFNLTHDEVVVFYLSWKLDKMEAKR